jgi:hypothetical protein
MWWPPLVREGSFRPSFSFPTDFLSLGVLRKLGPLEVGFKKALKGRAGEPYLVYKMGSISLKVPFFGFLPQKGSTKKSLCLWRA